MNNTDSENLSDKFIYKKSEQGYVLIDAQKKNKIKVENIKLEYFISGRCYFSFSVPKQDISSLKSGTKFELIFKTNDGFKVKQNITDQFGLSDLKFIKFYKKEISNIRISDPIKLIKQISRKKFLKTYFTNFLFEYNSTRYDGFEITIKNKKFEFCNIENYSISKNTIKKCQIPQITGWVYTDIDSSILKINRILKNLFDLISYSQRQFVQPVYQEELDNNGNICSLILSPKFFKSPRSGFNVVESDIIYINDKQEIVKFLSETYDNYEKYKKLIKLDYSLQYYLDAFIPKQAEIEYMLVFTAIESLLRHYEDYFIKQNDWDISKIKYDEFEHKIDKLFKKADPKFWESNNRIVKYILLASKNKFVYDRLTFQESLNITYNGKLNKIYKNPDFGFNIQKSKFEPEMSNIRNYLIHNGEFKGYSDIEKLSIDTKNLVFIFDKIFLSILKYEGYFRDFRNIESWIKLNR